MLPRGSGKTWNSSPEEVDTKVYCSGFGFWAVGGGRDDTLTVSETKKLIVSAASGLDVRRHTNYRIQDLSRQLSSHT